MDYIYLVDLNSFLSDEEIKLNDFCSCSVSNKNIFAFSNDCCTYILPLEKPNELIPVQLSNSPCIQLLWSDDGQYLLCFYKNGLTNIFSVKTSLLNTIELVYSFEIKSNDIIAIKSFSKSPKLCFSSEKRDSPNYLDKFYYKPYNFLKNFSKFSYNGFLILTKSGILHICLTDYNSVKNRFEKFEFDMKLIKPAVMDQMEQSDDNERIKYDLGDFSFETDGSINVIFSNYDLNSPIFIYKINLKFSNDSTSIEGTSELIATINFYHESMTSKTKLLFMSNESAQNFCVCLRSNLSNSDIIQVWKPAQLNQNLISPYDLNMTNEQCTLIKSIQCPSSLIQLNISKCFVAFKDLMDNRYLNDSLYLIASYQNGTCGFIDIQNYNQIFTSAIPIKIDSFAQNNDGNPIDLATNKKIRFTQEFIITMDQSYTGSIGVGITNLSRLAVFRHPFNKETNLQMQNQQSTLAHLFNLYEYSMLCGYDYWDLLISTNPKLIDSLIDKLEDKFQNQLQYSFQKIYFNRHFSLMFSFYKQTTSYNHFKSQDILTKLILNRLMSIISFSVQLNLNIDQIKTLFNNTPNLSVSLLSSNLDTINQPAGMLNNPILGQIPLKNNLYDYISDLLRIKSDSNIKMNFNLNDLKSLTLNDIVQSILNRKNYQLFVNQQLKHVFQWIVDMALYLTNVATSIRLNQTNINNQSNIFKLNNANHFGATLLNDLWFLNEIRKAIIYVKLLFTYSLNLAQSGMLQSQMPASNIILIQSLPVLPLRSSMQKDLLSDLYNIYTKIIYKTIEGGNILNDESIMDLCLNIQAETIIRPIDELLFNLKYSWMGNPSSLWIKTIQFPVNQLFDSEKTKQIYPLFDIIRLIQFGRSVSTKQCIRCGNYTESSKSSTGTNAKANSIYMQDSCGDKCICGGYWVLSPLQ